MREILFRGKRTDNGEWVEGIPIITHIGTFIVFEENPHYCGQYGYMEIDELAKVNPDTVGQFTGLCDKNGVRIYEGDIIKTHYANARKNDFIEQVVFKNGRFCSMYKLSEYGRMWANLPDGVPYLPQDKTVYMEYCEVIGNIHDNPELLGGADNADN